MHTTVPKSLKCAIVSQHDSNDCGAACLLSIIKYYKGDSNLESLKIESGTTKNGTTLLGLKEALSQHNIQSDGYLGTIEELKKEKRPAILHVTIDNSFNHYVVCYGFKDEKFHIIDPLIGYDSVDEKTLENIWESKKLLLIEETDDLSQSAKQNKYGWFLNVLRENSDKLYVALFLGIMISVLSLSTAFFIERIIDKYLSKNLILESIEFIFLWSFLLLANEVLTFARTHIIISQVFQFNIALLGQYFSKIFSMDVTFFDSKEVGDLVSRMNDAEIIEETTTEILGQILIDFLTILIVCSYLFFIDINIGFMILLSILFYLSIGLLNNKKIIRLQREQVLAHSKRESKFIDVFNNIDIIKSYNVELKYLGEIQEQYTNYEQKKKGLENHINRYNTSINLAQLFVVLSSFLYISIGILNSQFSIGVLFAVFILISRFNGSMRKIIILNINFQGAIIAISRLRDFVQLKTIENDIRLVNLEPKSDAIIELKDLSFKYAGHTPLIENINFKINKFGIYCLIGQNGSGKSTFLKVIKNLYPQSSGNIYVNGKSFSSYSMKDWNTDVVYVEQTPKIVNGTVFENLTLNRNLGQHEVIKFLEEHNFLEFINSFPDGLLTRIGLGGLPISGGQKQLIAILRGALLNPKVFLLDEPSSSIDSMNKNILISMLQNLKEDKVILISSHDPEFMERSDLIYKLENKSIVVLNLSK